MRTDFLMILPDALRSKNECAGTLVAAAGAFGVRGSMGPWFYREIAQAFSDALSMTPAGSKLLVSMDTPGGYVTGCFEACFDIQNIRNKYPDVKVGVFTDGMLCSAGYAIACAMTGGKKDEIVGTPNALIGSIGVIASRVEEDLPKSMPGFQIYYFATGADKIEGRLGTLLTEAEAQKIQADVDQIGVGFFDLVASARDLSAKQVKGLNAATFRGEAAQEAGLIDAVYASRSAYVNEPPPPRDDAMTPEEKIEFDKMKTERDAAQAESARVAKEAKDQIAARDAQSMSELIAARADLPEATRAALQTMPYAQAKLFADTLPLPAAAAATAVTETETDDEPAPKPANKPTSIVAPVVATDASARLPQADDSKVSDDMRSTLDRELPHRKLDEKALGRASYDVTTGIFRVN
jgi:ClpP class serine protease